MCFQPVRYSDPTRIPVPHPKPVKLAPPTKWVFEVEVKLQRELSISITDVFDHDIIHREVFDGNTKCHDLLVSRRDSFDTAKSYCSADGMNAESETDDDSFESLSLHGIFDDYEDTSDDEMSVDTMIISNRATTFKVGETSKPQVLPDTDCKSNAKMQQQKRRITEKRKRTNDSGRASVPDSARTRQLPHHLRSLLFAFSQTV
jgi:hypothetical protein